MAAAVDDAKVPSAVVSSAVDALMNWKSKAAPEKPQLLPQDDFVYLTLTLKKIPAKSRTNAYRIPLPHSLFDTTTAEVCLIVDDRPKSNLTSEAAKKIVKAQEIPVSKVISLSKLKANYKAFESRRKLCDSYELFLVDKRIVHLLPRLLGKSFFKKKKLPVPLELTRKDWKKHVHKAMGCGYLFMRTGTCCVMKVGKVSMEREEIVENVVDAIDGAVKVVPRNWDGVRSLHLKLTDSAALPVYQALPDLKLKIDGLVKNVEGGESEVSEVSTGVVEEKKKKKRGRIHEVQYMDVGAGAVELDGEEDKMEEVKNLEDAEDHIDSDDLGVLKKKKGVKKGKPSSKKAPHSSEKKEEEKEEEEKEKEKEKKEKEKKENKLGAKLKERKEKEKKKNKLGAKLKEGAATTTERTARSRS